jgi:hypothetical protein
MKASRPSRDTVGERPVEPGGDQRRRESAEEDGQPCEWSPHQVSLLKAGPEKLKLSERSIGIEIANDAPNSRKKAGPSKPAPGRHQAIEAQIRDEIAVMQGVMICDLRQDEHLVGPGAKEVRRVIEVRIGEPGVHAIAVIERAFEVGHDLRLRALRGSRGGVRFTLDV